MVNKGKTSAQIYKAAFMKTLISHPGAQHIAEDEFCRPGKWFKRISTTKNMRVLINP